MARMARDARYRGWGPRCLAAAELQDIGSGPRLLDTRDQRHQRGHALIELLERALDVR